MTRIEIKSRVGSDGVLELRVPVGPDEADREVIVTVESVGTGTATSSPATSDPQDREDWTAFVERTAGSISDPTFRRHDQGEYEQRDPWP